MDLVTTLPLSEGFDSIFVNINQLFKMCHFIPCNEITNSTDVAQMYSNHIWKVHSLPLAIIFD